MFFYAYHSSAFQFKVSNALVDGMITVKTDEICAAIKMCFNDTRCVVEPAGALSIAGTWVCFVMLLPTMLC